MAERAPRRRRTVMTDEEKTVIRDGWAVHRHNYVRILAYVRRHIPGHLRAVYERERNDAALRRRIRDYVQRELQDAVEEREREMRLAVPAAPWRAQQEDADQDQLAPPPSIQPPAVDNQYESGEDDDQHEPDRRPPQPNEPDQPARRREPLWALARRNQEPFADMLDAHEARMARVDRILDAIEDNL